MSLSSIAIGTSVGICTGNLAAGIALGTALDSMDDCDVEKSHEAHEEGEAKKSKNDASLLAIAIFGVIALLCIWFANAAAPSFVTPEMTYRNGLTDEQYKYLWSLGKTPQIDQNTARDWMFKSSRFSNTTNWLAICGASNDFARLSYVLGEDNYWLGETNRVLWATNSALTATCERLADDVKTLFIGYTNQLAQTTAYSNAYVIASVFAESAQAKVLDEIADLNAKIAKYEEYKTKYPLLKAVWNALIEDAQNRIRILEAVVSPGPSK